MENNKENLLEKLSDLRFVLHEVIENLLNDKFDNNDKELCYLLSALNADIIFNLNLLKDKYAI